MKHQHATIKEIVEFGLDEISAEQTIIVSLKDFMYIRRTLEDICASFTNQVIIQKLKI